MNTWPGGKRHAMTPLEHERWNENHYPGTRQICFLCEEPTGACEEDGIFTKDYEPLCEQCAADNPDLVDK